MAELMLELAGRFVGCTALGVALMMATPAQAQTAVAPGAGNGSEGNPYQISELGNLVWMSENVGSSTGKYYTLQNDIDASDTANWSEGFAPIGKNSVTNFSGIFNGNGMAIRNLSINRPTQQFVGLFGCLGGSGAVQDLGVAGGSVTGSDCVGGVVGANHNGIVSNCFASVAVTGVGYGPYVGGLVGLNGTYGDVGTVVGCYATGPVSGSGYVGGLVGGSYGVVSRCYATGAAAGTNAGVGGLVGYNGGFAAVSKCYATGAAAGSNYVGGLVGCNENLAMITDSYARGSATGYIAVGGLVGCNYGGTMTRCYSTGSATGCAWVGGLLGWWSGSIGVTDSFWDIEASGNATSAGGTGTNTAGMKQETTFVGWNFSNIWSITETLTYPLLRQDLARRTGLPWLSLLLGQ